MCVGACCELRRQMMARKRQKPLEKHTRSEMWTRPKGRRGFEVGKSRWN